MGNTPGGVWGATLQLNAKDLQVRGKVRHDPAETTVSVVAQVMGHKPSATAEKHYTVRPLDLLRVHHEKIEACILEQAG